VIFHVDMDAFYVSVERLGQPDLVGVPVVIGGSPESRGVVASASYEARRYGVRSAQPMGQALRLCPGLVRLPADMKAYGEHSRKVDGVLERFSPRIQKVSVDEAYLDMRGTERLHGPPDRAAPNLQRTILEELGLPCSVGGGRNKLIAKIASGQAKPSGIRLVEPSDERGFLDPLPVGVIPGVGVVAQKGLADMGIRTVADLHAIPEQTLIDRFGSHGADLAARARGEGSVHFPGRERPKSVSRETTFAEDIAELEVLEGVLARLLDRTAAALRGEELMAGGVTVKVRYHDFATTTHGEALPTPTVVDTDLMPVARRLLRQVWERRAEPVRLIGVRLDRLVASGQMGLFDQPSRRWEDALKGVDRVRDRYGFGSVRWGREFTGETGRRAEGDSLQEDDPDSNESGRRHTSD
jgi:DNA polymerase-4